MADLKIGHYMDWEKPKSTARNLCHKGEKKQVPHPVQRANGVRGHLKVAATFRGCWTEMGVADTLIVYASILYGG